MEEMLWANFAAKTLHSSGPAIEDDLPKEGAEEEDLRGGKPHRARPALELAAASLGRGSPGIKKPPTRGTVGEDSLTGTRSKPVQAAGSTAGGTEAGRPQKRLVGSRDPPKEKKGKPWWERAPPEYIWKDGAWKKKNTRGDPLDNDDAIARHPLNKAALVSMQDLGLILPSAYDQGLFRFQDRPNQ
eukprot:s5646_g5.t1